MFLVRFHFHFNKSLQKEMLIIIKRFCNIRFDFTSFICLWFLCTQVNLAMESKGCVRITIRKTEKGRKKRSFVSRKKMVAFEQTSTSSYIHRSRQKLMTFFPVSIIFSKQRSNKEGHESLKKKLDESFNGLFLRLIFIQTEIDAI